MMDDFIRRVFTRHIARHNSDFEVCASWLCRLAFWLEGVFFPERYEN